VTQTPSRSGTHAAPWLNMGPLWLWTVVGPWLICGILFDNQVLSVCALVTLCLFTCMEHLAGGG